MLIEIKSMRAIFTACGGLGHFGGLNGNVAHKDPADFDKIDMDSKLLQIWAI
jgi:hypothetical protein